MKTFNQRMNDIVILRNVTERDQSFRTKDKPMGVTLVPGGTTSVSVSDLRTSLNNDPFLYGVDSLGRFATLYIEDADVREILGFEEYTYKEKDGVKTKGKITKKQVLLTKENFVNLVSKSNKAEFKSFIEDLGKISVGNKMTLKRILQDEENESLRSVAHSKIVETLEALRYY